MVRVETQAQGRGLEKVLEGKVPAWALRKIEDKGRGAHQPVVSHVEVLKNHVPATSATWQMVRPPQPLGGQVVSRGGDTSEPLRTAGTTQAHGLGGHLVSS